MQWSCKTVLHFCLSCDLRSGLLAVIFYAPYDMCGAKFLWCLGRMSQVQRSSQDEVSQGWRNFEELAKFERHPAVTWKKHWLEVGSEPFELISGGLGMTQTLEWHCAGWAFQEEARSWPWWVQWWFWSHHFVWRLIEVCQSHSSNWSLPRHGPLLSHFAFRSCCSFLRNPPQPRKCPTLHHMCVPLRRLGADLGWSQVKTLALACWPLVCLWEAWEFHVQVGLRRDQ